MRWLANALRRACACEAQGLGQGQRPAPSRRLGGPGGSDGWLAGALALLDAAGGAREAAAIAGALADGRLRAAALQPAGALYLTLNAYFLSSPGRSRAAACAPQRRRQPVPYSLNPNPI